MTAPAPPPIGLYEGIVTTRAMRRLSDEPIQRSELEAVLRAAQQGPSGGNIQPWQFVVVTDPVVRSDLGEIYRQAYERYEAALLASMPPHRDEAAAASWERTLAASRHLADHIGAAPAIIVVLMPDIDMTLVDDEGALDVGTPYASVYPAVQNLLLAARSMGIGGALTTVHRVRQDEVRSLLGVPDRFQTVALIPLGRPSGRFGVAPRRPVESVTHWDHYGEREAFGPPPEGFDR
ncbi:MAG: nitroreductase family protein [Acidimicrobiales bacterium]